MACTSTCTESFSLGKARRMTNSADMLLTIQHLEEVSQSKLCQRSFPRSRRVHRFRGAQPDSIRRTQSYCPVPLSASRICLPRPTHPDAGRGSQVQHDQAEGEYDSANHQPVEPGFSCFRNRCSGHEPSWTVGFRTDTEA